MDRRHVTPPQILLLESRQHDRNRVPRNHERNGDEFLTSQQEFREMFRRIAQFR